MDISYHLGIDLHKKFSYWTLLNQKREILFQGKVPTAERETVQAIKALQVSPSLIQAAVEPVSQWGWYADILEREGMHVKLVNTLNTKLIAGSRLKNDKVDSSVLAELLRTDFLPTAYLAPQETRELRELLRFRLFLSRTRSKIKNRIHAILWKHGLESPRTDLFGKKGIIWLKEQILRPVFSAELESLLRTVDQLSAEIELADKDIRQKAKLDDETRLLMTMPGIGPYTALMIQAEVGDWSRFSSPEKLASFAGLVSSSYSSGEKTRFGRITRKGSAYLRSVMVEAACQVRSKKNSLHQFYERLKEKKGNKIARVALARKMLTVLWHMINKKEPFRAQSCFGDSNGVKR